MKKEKIISALIIALLFLPLMACADDEDPTRAEPLAKVIGGELVKMLAKWWIAYAAKDLFEFLIRMTEHLREFIVANPPMEDIKGAQGFFISLMSPFFVLGIVLTSAYLLLYSESPRGRSKAKGVLVRLIYALILVSLSPLIIELLLTLSSGLAGSIIDYTDVAFAGTMLYEGGRHMFDVFYWLTLLHRTGGVELLLLWETFLLIMNFVIAMRYLLVILWSVLFPVSLLLFSFTPTKRIGKKFLHQTFLWTFVQVGWAISILLINASVKGMDEIMPGYPATKMGLTCIFLFLTTPRVIWGLMDWLSLGVEVVEIVNAAPLSMGALTMDEMKVERAVIVEEPALEGV
ncbi:MAG: hypothetical protein WAX07_10860 [Candidatus Altiarchaeia archaeon]